MSNRVQILGRGAHVFLPVDTPYDWEVLLDYLEAQPAGDSDVQLDTGGEALHVTRRLNQLCSRCGRRPHGWSFVATGNLYCRSCAYSWIREHPFRPRPGNKSVD